MNEAACFQIFRFDQKLEMLVVLRLWNSPDPLVSVSFNENASRTFSVAYKIRDVTRGRKHK